MYPIYNRISNKETNKSSVEQHICYTGNYSDKQVIIANMIRLSTSFEVQHKDDVYLRKQRMTISNMPNPTVTPSTTPTPTTTRIPSQARTHSTHSSVELHLYGHAIYQELTSDNDEETINLASTTINFCIGLVVRFSVYVNDLIDSLRVTNVGCSISNVFMG